MENYLTMSLFEGKSGVAYSGSSVSLADGASLDSGWIDLSNKASYQLSLFAAASGLSLVIDSSEVEGGGGINDTSSTTALQTSFLSTLPVRERYMRFRITNNSGGAIANVKFEVKTNVSIGTGASTFPLYVSPGEFSPALLTQAVALGKQPDGDYVLSRADGGLFNTSVNLAAGETFTSDWYDIDGYATLEFFVRADVPSATKGLKIEWTNDAQAGTPTIQATNYREYKTSDVRIGYAIWHIRPKLDGVRVTYTNGGLAQSSVYIEVVVRTEAEVGLENSAGAVTVGEFGREVALGTVSNYTQTTKFGRNSEVDSGTSADIWGGGRNTLGLHSYTGFNATANENLSTASSSIADVGSLISSGTVTTTDTNNIIDSGATFISDSVVVGDIVLNDTRGTYGYVTAIPSETQLTIFTMIDSATGRYDNILGNSYRVARATSTGSGVVVIRRILNSDYESQTSKFVILNGTSTVSTTVDAYRCSRASVLLAGSTENNVGEITIRQATTTANIFCVMPEGGNQTLSCCDTVPKNTITLIESVLCQMSISGGGSASGVVSLRTRPKGGVFNTIRVYDLSSAGGSVVDAELGGIALQQGTDFKLRVDSTSSNNVRFSGKMEYLEINEIT